jgi:short-subunit dehydrogenase
MKIALITGAASGIGLALTNIYLQKKYTVLMVDYAEDKLNSAAEYLLTQFPNQIVAFTCDVTDAKAVSILAQQVEQQVNQIDLIYNNAGIIGHIAPIWELTPEQISQVINVNVYGMIHIIKAFMPLLFKQTNPSHIVNMASLFALCSGSQMAPYSMSKHAVLALTESLFFDLQRLEKPIDISVVFPSFTDTSLLNINNQSISPFHESLNDLLAHSRPALDVALHIIEEVEQKKFYIFPDKEVKGYTEERINAMILQTNPHINNIEKLMNSLIKRKMKK